MRPEAATLTKRLFDMIVSGLLLLLLALPMALIASVILVSMGRPVLFRQERPGLKGKPFTLIKFRTMRLAWDRNGQPLPDGARLTGLGRFLRRTSLDELPELFNVLKGDMSLVGPRPLLMEYLDLYSPEQARRHELPPGITGLAQVKGRNALDWEEKFRLDAWYVNHWSLWLDLKILAMTLWAVVSGTGVSQEGHATREKFRGTPR